MATTHLTAREAQVRDLAADGLTNEAIADQLGLSRRTVEAHLRMIYRKTGLSSRAQLASPPMLVDSPSARIAELEQLLAVRELQLRSYGAAMRRIIDRQFPLYDEEVEIIVSIGADPLEDVVTERHRTRPHPYVIYRVIRPIAALGISSDELVEQMAIRCQIDKADVGIAVEVVVDADQRPLALILFQPGLEQPTEWTLRYRAPGLWDPLRTAGVDRLSWAAGTLDGRYAEGLDELRVRFEFPAGVEGAVLPEQGGAAQIERVSDTEFVFVDRSRTGGRYNWELKMRPLANG